MNQIIIAVITNHKWYETSERREQHVSRCQESLSIYSRTSQPEPTNEHARHVCARRSCRSAWPPPLITVRRCLVPHRETYCWHVMSARRKRASSRFFKFTSRAGARKRRTRNNPRSDQEGRPVGVYHSVCANVIMPSYCVSRTPH